MNFFVCLSRIEQRPNNIVMIGKNRKNHYCYNRLILETSIKITKMRTMRWGTVKKWLCESCKDYASIEYQVVIDEKAEVTEIKTKIS